MSESRKNKGKLKSKSNERRPKRSNNKQTSSEKTSKSDRRSPRRTTTEACKKLHINNRSSLTLTKSTEPLSKKR